MDLSHQKSRPIKKNKTSLSAAGNSMIQLPHSKKKVLSVDISPFNSEKLPLLRTNTHEVEKSLSKSETLKIYQKSTTINSISPLKFIESKLKQKLENINNNDHETIFKAHLDILENIISIDPYGPVLEKIRVKIMENLNAEKEPKNKFDSQSMQDLQEKFEKLKENFINCESAKKSLEAKLKKLSIENIQISKNLEFVIEENNLWKEFKKTVKLVDGTPDFMPLLKELKYKSAVIESLDKKLKDLQIRDRKQSGVLKLVKEKGVNLNELISNYRDRRSSSDSFNISRFEMNETQEFPNKNNESRFA